MNTQTGNRLTTMPITGWKTKGGGSFGLTLFHNAQDNVDVGWGQNWRSNFDMRVLYTGNTVNGNKDYLTVIYPTGKRIAYTRRQTGVRPIWGPTFYPPKGYYDVVYAIAGGYRLRTKDQATYLFNSNGQLTSQSDRYGNATTLTYGANKLQKATDAAGRALTFAWGNAAVQTASGFTQWLPCIASVKNPAGQTWTLAQGSYSPNGPNGFTKYLYKVYLPALESGTTAYEHLFGYTNSGAINYEAGIDNTAYRFVYDSYLRLTSFTDPNGNVTRYTYNGGNTVVTKPDGGRQTDFYDSGALRSEQDEAGYSKSFLYDANYNLAQVTDERGNVQRFEYDAYGNRTAGQDPRQYAAGVKSRTTYNAYNDAVTQVDARGATTTLTRDPYNGVVLSVKDGLGNVVVTNSWDSTGSLTGTSAANATTTVAYDAKGNPQTLATPNGSVTLVYTDARFPDKPTRSTDDRNRTTSYVYDAWGRTVQVTRSDGANLFVQYDLMSRVTKLTDWLGHVTFYTYDAGGRRVSKKNARGDIESYGYDPCNRVQTITDGRGKVRTYLYTLRGEVAALYLPDGAAERYQYDGGGNQTSRMNALGEVTRYAYDAADNLVSVAYPAGPGVAYAYDLDGRMTSMVDATGASTWSYDLANRTTGLTTPQGSQTYGYDGWGRRTTLSQGGGNVTTTNYANEKLASVVKAPENETTTWSYDAVGRVTAQNLPNGAVTSYGYDALDRVSAITHRRANGTTITAESYAYDAGGNLTYKVVDGVRTDYTYDAIDQLLSESTPGSTLLYTYDANGNRLTKKADGNTETYAYDAGDKLLSRSGVWGTFTYGYDACGRTRTVQAPNGTTTLTYDYEDRLTGIVGPGVNAAYAYNGADARVGKSGTGGSRTYRRDGVGVTALVLSDGLATMVPGVSERSNGATRFSHLDRLGTNAKTTDASGSVVDSKRHDAFGLPRLVSSAAGSQKGFASAFGYQEDAESGLKLLGHRYYDAGSGRFITRDPVGSGMNWYRYCDNNPLKRVDPNGYQIRNLTDDERGQVQQAIDFMRSQGETEAADSLQHKLNHGRIKVDTENNGNYMETDADGKTIYIHLSTFGDEVLGSRIHDRRDPIRNKSFIRANQIYFSSLLFHEWVHTTQGQYWKAYHPNVSEQNAWAMQANFIVRYLDRMDHGIVRGSFKDYVREFMQEFWGTAIRSYHDYGGVGP